MIERKQEGRNGKLVRGKEGRGCGCGTGERKEQRHT